MSRSGPNLLRWVSVGLLLAALATFFFELVAYSAQRARMPRGMTIAGVPVGGLDQTEAIERLLQTYGQPVELHYGQNIILMTPASAGFQLDTESMMAAAELARTGTEFWSGFWDFLWNRPSEPIDIPVRLEYSQSQLETVLRDVAARYDEPPTPSQPVPGSPNFLPGQPGLVLDIARSRELVGEVLASPAGRRVNLPIVTGAPTRPTMDTLQTLLRQIIDVAQFDGLAAVYIRDLRTGDDLHLTYYRNQRIASEPDPAFTAASIIKIGIMTAFYRYFDGPFDEEADRWLTEMITLSGNDPADWLMERISVDRGPLVVTDVLQDDLGLQNTFIAGYFHLGAPLLWSYQTPANSRQDINTQPDRYNQTTATDIGSLLGDIYACAKGGGSLLAAEPGLIRPAECQHMLDLLAENKIGILIEAGVPEGTRVAHKHGWTDSPLDSIGDAAVVYSPGGDYVVVIFLWDSPEMIFGPTSDLITDLSRAVYNFFNPPSAP
ncbi:MAG TPA: serine hydrolase [Anaerolineales bacterium]|nr:serine hydrolase [Anaerolineales bacterium]